MVDSFRKNLKKFCTDIELSKLWVYYYIKNVKYKCYVIYYVCLILCIYVNLIICTLLKVIKSKNSKWNIENSQ